MGPSATNKQPWRIVRRGADWHFYLLRTKGYGKGSPFFKLLRIADLQRVDLGIAMCHFELVAREAGADGRWIVEDPGLALPGPGIEYTATWRGSSEAARTPSPASGRRPAAVAYDGRPSAHRREEPSRPGHPRRDRARPEHQPHVPGLRPRQPVRPARPLLRAGAGRGAAAGAAERPRPAAGRELLGVFTLREEHQSYPGRLHGGVSSAILDETIGRAILLLQPGAWGVTVEFTVRFRKPLPLDEEIRCVARITRDTSRLFEGSGEILLAGRQRRRRGVGQVRQADARDITDDDFAEREWFTDPREAPDESTCRRRRGRPTPSPGTTEGGRSLPDRPPSADLRRPAARAVRLPLHSEA